MKTIEHLRDLTPDPANARRHNSRNVGVISDALHEVGAARSIVIDERGVILAGNATVEAAAAAGIERVQVVDADGETIIAVRRTGLTDRQKTRLALFDNRANDLSDFDPDVLAALVEADTSIADGMFGEDELADLLATAALGDPLAEDEPADDEAAPLGRGDVPDALFATDNEWGVPVLDARLQATALDLPVTRWGGVARTSRMGGTWHFYTDDYKFAALWTDPSPLVNSRCVNAIEPNVSTNDQMPRAVVLWGVYRKRWLARWWQSHGVRVFVDLNVDPRHAALNMLGVPIGWRAYATRGYGRFIDDLDGQYATACERAGSGDVLFVVIGGGESIRQRCMERAWPWVPEESDSARGKYADG